MDIRSLFKLDSGKYSLSNSAGAFRRVKENTKPLSIGDLIGDLVAPKIPSKEELPKVTPVDTEGINSFMSAFGPSKGTLDSLVSGLMSAYKMHPGYESTVRDSIVAGTPVRDARDWKYYTYGTSFYNANQSLKQAISTFNPYRSTYSSGIGQYNTTYKPQIDTYNAEVSAYNAATADVRKEVDEYQAEVSRRTSEANTGLVNPNRVDKETSQKTGDILADTELYSEGLHSMMIDRISAQPVIDEMSALFSKGSK